MDFSTGPWPWIVLTVAMTHLLAWFALGLIRHGFAFYHLQLRDEPAQVGELRNEFHALEARMQALERRRSSEATEPPIERLRQKTNGAR